MVKKVTIAVLGAGHRGNNYGNYVAQHPYEVQLVAVAEPNNVSLNERRT